MISVIIPIYKVEAYLEKCIESVRSQTYKDIEIILVDDGSPDNCGAVCDRYQKMDERIKVLHKENGGLSDARNKGLDIATGEYVLFVDSDDFIHPNMIELLYCSLQETDADISVCGFKTVSEEYKISFDSGVKQGKREVFEGQEVMNQLQHKNLLTVVAWNKLYKRKLFADIRYPKGKIHEDEFLTHQILHLCERTVYISQELYYYVKREESITGQIKPSNVACGWEAYEGRLAFLEQNGYTQMVQWTKLHMLHYVCVYYGKLNQNRENRAFLMKLRKAFLDLYKEKEVKDALSAKLKREYKYFAISPWLYYNRKMRIERTVRYKALLKERLKGFLKK